MKAYRYILAATLVAMSMSSCSDDNSSLSGEGTVYLSPELKSDVKIISRAEGDETLSETLNDSFMLWISNSKGVIRQYNGLDQVPEELTMLAGTYIAEAWAGDSVPASWTDRWFKGSAEFTVTNNQVTNVPLPCKLANVAVTVSYDETIDQVLEDYSIQVGHSRGALTFDDEHQGSIGYFMMPSTDQDLSYTLTATKRADGTTYTRTETIENVQPAHQYNIKLSCAASDPTVIGGAFIDIAIDDTEIYREDTELVPLAPIIKGSGYNINEVQYCDLNKVGKRSIYIFATSYLKNVVVECDQLAQIFGEEDAKDFDAMTCSAATKATLNANGVLFKSERDENTQTEQMKVTFDEDFCNTYFCTEGVDYKITVKATDTDNQTATRTLSIRISADPIAINDVNTSLIAFSHKAAAIDGQILKAEKIAANSPIVVYYAPSGSNAWSNTEAVVDGEAFSANISGLTPGTTYQYYAAVDTEDGQHFNTETKTFTTEPATQLPNSGFENWQKPNDPYLIYGSGESMWWDSGNHGSASFGGNITEPDGSIKHSGNYSIHMTSKYVVVKFAAGNVFIGEYLKTDGTDGVLGWGRPFTGRPSKLKGYVKYSPVVINKVGSDAPQEAKDAKNNGELDRGIIYCALMDSHTETYDGKTYPVIIKTKSSQRQLFDKNSDYVIAYGEALYTEATAGDGLVEFTINLDYKRTDERPSYIVLTASSSFFGDYYSGGQGSEMWLDDLELVYE